MCNAFGDEGSADCGWAGIFAIVAFGETGHEGCFAGVGGAEEDYFDFGGGDFNVWHTTIIVVIEICGLGGTYFWSLLSYYCVELRRYMKRDNGRYNSGVCWIG
jgi:hypothetical protein